MKNYDTVTTRQLFIFLIIMKILSDWYCIVVMVKIISSNINLNFSPPMKSPILYFLSLCKLYVVTYGQVYLYKSVCTLHETASFL